jgi:hypothetical protein
MAAGNRRFDRRFFTEENEGNEGGKAFAAFSLEHAGAIDFFGGCFPVLTFVSFAFC